MTVKPVSSCNCEYFGEGGGMGGPRLWECPEHGVTGFVDAMGIVKAIQEDYNVPLRIAWGALDLFIKAKEAEAQLRGDCWYVDRREVKKHPELDSDCVWVEAIQHFLPKRRIMTGAFGVEPSKIDKPARPLVTMYKPRSLFSKALDFFTRISGKV